MLGTRGQVDGEVGGAARDGEVVTEVEKVRMRNAVFVNILKRVGGC